MGVSNNCEAQNSPAVKVHAYAREVIGGIPGGPPGVGAPERQTRYFIYLETPPQTQFTVDGVWMDQKYYEVETSLKKAPVRFDSPVKLAQDERSIAVPATSNTVTEIILREPAAARSVDREVTTVLAGNQAVLQLQYAGKPLLVPVKKFEKRDPIYMR